MSLQTKLSAFIERKVAGGFYAGAVAKVERKGQVIADICFGRLGADLSEPIQSDALFSLESISKVVCTAPLTLSLSEEGVFGLDQPLATWLPEFQKDGKEKITARHILCHSSGLPDTDDPCMALDASMPLTELWKSILETKLLFPVGQRVNYSDLGYLCLGRAIEVAAGENLDSLARKRIWLPLGMKDTRFNPDSSTTSRMTSNRGLRGACVDSVDRALGGIVGCDGVFSTAADLMLFGKMLLGKGTLDGKRVLSAESVQELSRDHTPFATPDEKIAKDFEYLMLARKGLGWELAGSRYCHGGTGFSPRAFGKVGGTGTFLWVDPAQELVAVYLTNHGQPIPFNSDGWSTMIGNVGVKDFFNAVNEGSV